MLKELINYEFKNKELENEILNLNDNLISIGDKFINDYLSLKLNKEFIYYEDGVKYYFSLDILNNLKTKLLSSTNLAERAIKLHLNDIYDKNDRYHDLLKAIIGAYLIDNASINYDFIDQLLNLDDSILLNIDNSNNYYNTLNSWSKNKYKKALDYKIELINDKYITKINIEGFNNEFTYEANTKYLSLINACKLAFKELENNNLLLKMEDIVGKPEIDKCLNQLQELYDKGFIKEPIYKIQMKNGTGGSSIWRCRIVIDGYKESFTFTDISKKIAKRNCAFEMLKYIINNQEK